VRCFLVLISLLILCPVHSDAQERQLRIGVITPLTGPMATIGTAVKNGIELARKEHPELFENLTFAYEDDQFDSKQSLTAYRKLKAAGQLNLLLGFGTNLAQAIGPLVERDKLTFINFSFEAAPVVGKKFLIRSMNHTGEYTAALADYLAKSGENELPIIQTESTFFSAMIDGVRKAGGSKIKLQEIARVSPGEVDFRSVIAKLKVLKRRAIGVFLWPEQLIAFFRQARELGLDAQYFGTDLCETAAALTEGRGLAEGCLYPDNDADVPFRSRYRTAYGNEAQLTFAGSAYDMTILVGEIFRAEQILSAGHLLGLLQSTREKSGVLGVYSFRESPELGQYFAYPVVLKRIEGVRGVPVKGPS